MLVPGTRLGNYEIVSALGAGGMGEVYRARDTRLRRDVALKVLPQLFAADPDRVARFAREAQLLASLNHPNIAAIHGFEDTAATHALVLELVEGPTLADRIAQGPIPLDEALPIARQIADALEAAHDLGVIHRDLKPANIKVRPDGTVKVLDFGLAKLAETPAAVGNANVTASPTITSPAMMTGVGVLLGTAAYMSPEQARGRPVDKRTDIWSFGCVLYEMLTARRPFEGSETTDVLARVLEREPDLSSLPRQTPVALHRLFRRTLEKDRRKRLDSAAAARLELEDALSDGGPLAAAERTAHPRSIRIAWSITAAVVVLASALLVWALQSDPPDERLPTWLSIPPPHNEFAKSAAPAISPDGRRIAFWATNERGESQLWLRRLDSPEAISLPGTHRPELAYFEPPFWSPDGRSIGFFAEGKLKRIDVDTGPSPVELADVSGARGGSWGSDDTIIYVPSLGSTIYRIAAAGGRPEPLPRLQLATGEASWCTDPSSLPASNHFFVFCTADSGKESGVYIVSLDDMRATPLAGIASNVVYAAGHIFFGRGSDLFAQEFDTAELELRGEAYRIAQQLGFAGSGLVTPAVTVSSQGTLAVWTGRSQPLTHFTLFDRNGQRVGTMGEPAEQIGLMVSPNEKEAVSEFHDVQLNWIDLMRLDLATGTTSRFTTRAGETFMGWGANTALWSPDSRQILFTEGANSWTLKDTATGKTEHVFEGATTNWLLDWSPDGQYVVYGGDEPSSGADLWLFPISGERKPRRYLASPYMEWQARVSPDSRWLAYSSNESGRFEVYVQSFPDAGRKSRISRTGGWRPMWRPDGQELFYISADNKVMAASISVTETGVEVSSTPTALFPSPLAGFEDAARPQYWPLSNGARFLFNVPADDAHPRSIRVLLNWQSLVRQ